MFLVELVFVDELPFNPYVLRSVVDQSEIYEHLWGRGEGEEEEKEKEKEKEEKEKEEEEKGFI